MICIRHLAAVTPSEDLQRLPTLDLLLTLGLLLTPGELIEQISAYITCQASILSSFMHSGRVSQDYK